VTLTACLPDTGAYSSQSCQLPLLNASRYVSQAWPPVLLLLLLLLAASASMLLLVPLI
jgi:hypothetical protein